MAKASLGPLSRLSQLILSQTYNEWASKSIKLNGLTFYMNLV